MKMKYFTKGNIPSRKHKKDAGADLYSVEDVSIPPMSFGIVDTGTRFHIPTGYMMQLWPKSRSDFLLGAGIVDEPFVGQIKVKVFNCTPNILHFSVGDPVCQAVLVKTSYPELEYQSDTEFEKIKTDRGATGGIVTQKAQMTFISPEEAEKF